MQGHIRSGKRWALALVAALVPLTAAMPTVAKPVAVPVAAPAAEAPAPVNGIDPRIARALTHLQQARETQFDFSPTPPQPPRREIQAPQWMRDLFQWLGGSGQGLMTALAYLLIAIVLAYILYLFVPAVRDGVDAALARWRKPKPARLDDDEPWQPDAQAARNLLAEADRLAAAGQFTEAVHLLLGRSLEELATRRPGMLKPALTARAIVLLDDIPTAAARAFAGLARAVERGIWAQRPLAEMDWQQARADYAAFALASHWQAGRA